MRSAISRRATVSSCSSSAWRAFRPSAVMTTGSLKPHILVLRGEAATPLAVIAHGHQRVRDPRAQHEIAGVAGERDRARRPLHRDRRAAAGGQDLLQLAPDGGRLRGEDRDVVDGGFHAAHPTRTYVRFLRSLAGLVHPARGHRERPDPAYAAV